MAALLRFQIGMCSSVHCSQSSETHKSKTGRTNTCIHWGIGPFPLTPVTLILHCLFCPVRIRSFTSESVNHVLTASLPAVFSPQRRFRRRCSAPRSAPTRTLTSTITCRSDARSRRRASTATATSAPSGGAATLRDRRRDAVGFHASRRLPAPF